MAESKTYRFKVTSADGLSASSAIFSWLPSGQGHDNIGAAGSGLIDVASPAGSAEVSAVPAEDEDHVEVTGVDEA